MLLQFAIKTKRLKRSLNDSGEDSIVSRVPNERLSI